MFNEKSWSAFGQNKTVWGKLHWKIMTTRPRTEKLKQRAKLRSDKRLYARLYVATWAKAHLRNQLSKITINIGVCCTCITLIQSGSKFNAVNNFQYHLHEFQIEQGLLAAFGASHGFAELGRGHFRCAN